MAMPAWRRTSFLGRARHGRGRRDQPVDRAVRFERGCATGLVDPGLRSGR